MDKKPSSFYKDQWRYVPVCTEADNPQNMLLFNRKHFIDITFTCPHQHKRTHTLSVDSIVV